MPYTTVIRLPVVVGNPANGFPARLLGVCVLLKPMPANWAAGFHQKLKAREDREELARRSESDKAGTANRNLTFDVYMGLAVALVGFNWWLWQNGNILIWIFVDASVLAFGFLILCVGYKLRSKRGSSNFDEAEVRKKLGSHALEAEIRLIAFVASGYEQRAYDALDGLATIFRGFDHPAGNRLWVGKRITYSMNPKGRRGRGVRCASELGRLHPITGKRMKRSVVSAKEAATIWHPPIVDHDIATTDRAGSAKLTVNLRALDDGPLIGYTTVNPRQKVRLSQAVMLRHTALIGKPGFGKSTVMISVMRHKLQAKAQGLDDSALVFVDPHGDAVEEILPTVPKSVISQIRYIDLGSDERLPAINVLDPRLFGSREMCVDTITNTVRAMWRPWWGPYMEAALKHGCMAIYEFNCHADTTRDSKLTLLDLPALFAKRGRRVPDPSRQASDAQLADVVLSRVSEPMILKWFAETFPGWTNNQRDQTVASISNRVDSFQSNERARALLGRPQSTINVAELVRQGQVLLLNTAAGTVGSETAALIGSVTVALVDAALKEQQRTPPALRRSCLVVIDEFQNILGVNWESIFAETLKYGGSFLIATQSLVRLNEPGRNLGDVILDNCVNLN